MVLKILHTSIYFTKNDVYYNQYLFLQLFQVIQSTHFNASTLIHTILQGIQHYDKHPEHHHHPQVNLASFGIS